MTEQITNQNVLLLAEIANLSYRDTLAEPQTDILTNAGFTHVAASTPNYNPYAWVDDFGNLHAGQVHYGFSGQSFYSGGSNTLVIGLRGTASTPNYAQFAGDQPA